MTYDCDKCYDDDCRGNPGYTDPTCAQHSGKVKLPSDVRALRAERDELRAELTRLRSERFEAKRPLLETLRQIVEVARTGKGQSTAKVVFSLAQTALYDNAVSR